MYKYRTLLPTLLDFSRTFKVVLITGPRQIGKTTFLQNSAQGARHYVTLDNPQDLLTAKTEPELFFEKYAPPVFIDEVQYAPELFHYIKMLADNSRQKGRIWLTGSQQFNLMQGVTESLAGRVVILNLLGFSLYECANQGRLQKRPFLPAKKPAGVLRRRTAAETFRLIWQGAFPAVQNLNPKKRAAFYDAYIQTYIERDVRQLVNVGDELTFLRFLKIAAARTGQILRLEDLARNADVSAKTAKSWLSVLQASGLVYLLPPYFKNITKRLSKAPKFYFTDTGLAAYLAGWNIPEALETGAASGAFFETFVLAEILKSYYHHGLTPQLYYYRDAKNNEIDLLIQQNDLYYPIEIKKTTRPVSADIKTFKLFAKLEKLGYGNLICLTKDYQPLTAAASAISVWDI
jgi:predicted AAA+ superfamily ATPase